MELGTSPRAVLLQPVGEKLGRTEGRTSGERRDVHAAPRDERCRRRAGARRVVVEPEVHEGAEVVAGDLAAGLRPGRARLLDAGAELLGGDEGGEPAGAPTP